MIDVKKQSQVGVGLIQKTFQVLDLFQLDRPDWSQSELILETGMSRSTASRLVRYLVDTGYLVQHPSSGRYMLGVAAADLGRRAMAGFDLKAICQPALEQLSEITDETILLTSLDRSAQAVICVDQIESRCGGLRVFEKIGASFPLHAGAAPRAVLALLPVAMQNAYLQLPLKKFTDHTMASEVELRREIKKIRDAGYSISVEETYEGAAGIAAPFVGPDEYPWGSIAIAFPLNRLTENEREDMGRKMADISKRISILLRKPEG
ncbi:IclR family transcriptional regulator [Kiloniella antarctica]|uniref:IclR family transcriptional regulator n=1 Tax=Kiloniella antarctica TaxID=1550907 RepID=A0ABW5BM54_9PROT